MVEARGETTSEEEEEVLLEKDEVKVLQMLLVEERIRTQVIQVAIGLINKKFNVIIVRNLVIMHMNAGRNNMTKEGKAPNQSTSTNTPTSAMLMASTSPIECNAVQESPHDIWYLDSGCNNHMIGNLNLFSV